MMYYAIFVVLALAIGIAYALQIKENVEFSSISAIRCLVYSLFLAFALAMAAWIGILLGDLLMFPIDGVTTATNKAIAAGLLVATAVLVDVPFLSPKRQRPMFDLSHLAGMFARILVQEMYVLLSYIALGIVGAYKTSYWAAILTLFLIVFLLSWVGCMFGRQKVAVNLRRWAFLSFVLFIAVVVAVAVYS